MLINQAKTDEIEEGLLEVPEAETLYWVKLKEALDRLNKNEDFKLVIKQGYFKDKAINGVSLLATDYVRQNGLRNEVLETLVGISLLEDYFATVQSMGTISPDDEEE